MAAFEVLLNRFCEQRSFLDDALVLEAFDDRPRPDLEKAWYSWAYSQRAIRNDQPQLALAWLDAGGHFVARLDDPILAAEYAFAEATCWSALDEPREAVEPARYAWHAWSSLASDPPLDDLLPSARVLMAVLSEPHPAPELSDDEILGSWFCDRLSLALLSSAIKVMQMYADFRDPEAAQLVADTFLDWVERNVAQGPAKEFSGLLAARVLTTLGDVYDRSGNSTTALAVFQEALARLKGLPRVPEIDHVRGQLRFNSGNQLGKLGRTKEAQKEFEASAGLLKSTGDQEAILRCRYAACITRFKVHDLDGLEETLLDLAKEYEEVVSGAKAGSQMIAARQSLDRVYRLWLRITAERLDTQNEREVFLLLHQIFALKEEDGKFTGILLQARSRPEAHLITEVAILLDRAAQHAGLGILVIEQVVDALLFVAIRPGSGPWIDRFSLQVISHQDGIDAVTGLILSHRDVADRLGEISLPIRSEPSRGFVATCQAAWNALSHEIRAGITASETLMTCVDSQTDLNEFPVELLYDGTNYVGLEKSILRTPSLRDLNLLLCENRTNAATTGSAIVLRADDDLTQANEEAEIVFAALESLELEPQVLKAPSQNTVLRALGQGVDLLHYVGHGLADEVGEELPLGPESRLPARALETLHPAPAPVTVLSACLAGRGRQLKTGHEQGFATQLLRRGSPAVVAALYLVPDRFAIEFSEILYSRLSNNTLSEALRETRQILAEEGCHPAAWASFVIFGRPGVHMPVPHKSEATTWPSAVFRYLATGAASHRDLARNLLSQDDRLSPAARADVKTDFERLASGDGDDFGPEILSTKRDFDHHPEAMTADRLLRIFSVIRHARFKSSQEREQYERYLIGEALQASQILGDTYVHIAATIELSKRILFPGEGNQDLLIARRRLRWLSGDGANFDKARTLIE